MFQNFFEMENKLLFHFSPNQSAGMQRATSESKWIQEVFVNWLLFSGTITPLFRSVPFRGAAYFGFKGKSLEF